MLREEIRELVAGAVRDAYGSERGFAVPKFSVEAPENAAHGDYATNIAMALAKVLRQKPMAVADKIAEKIKSRGLEYISRVEIAPPGFINFFISDDYLLGELNNWLENDGGFSPAANWVGKKVMVEFTDPNPFKEFHIGHLYSNIVGEALCRVFEAGGAVVKRVNYQGDVGLHVAKAIWGMQKKMADDGLTLPDLEKEDLDGRIKFMGRAYAAGASVFEEGSEAIKREITELNKKIFELDDAIMDLYTKGREWSLKYFERIYQRLGTKFDFYYFERDVGQVGLELVKANLEKGVFEKSDGAVVFPGEKYGLHRRVFVSSENLPTYEAKELGLAPTKYKDFPYDLSIIVTGNEIIDYFKVLLAALKEINPKLGEKTLHIAHGMVRLASGKMSSRTGEVVRAEDLLNEVKERVAKLMESSAGGVAAEKKQEIAEWIAVGAVKYSLLRVGVGKDIVFDIGTSLSLEGDSGPYLQYAHARLKSILRKVGGVSLVAPSGVVLDEIERQLVVSLLRYPEAIADALTDYTPSTLAGYLYKLAQLSNEFYHSHPVTQETDAAKKELRIALVSAVALTLAKGLNLLGIAAPEEM